MSGIVVLVLRIILVLSLYGFLGWALYTLWIDMKQQGQMLAARTPAILLSSEDGSIAHRFTKPEVSIGRDPACDCPLEDKTVSTQHARLIYRQNQWWLEDLRSTNGTFLNQEQVSSPIVITTGDQLRCGHVVLNIEVGDNHGRQR